MEVSSSVKSMEAATGSLSETTGPAAPAKTRGGGRGGGADLINNEDCKQNYICQKQFNKFNADKITIRFFVGSAG